MNEEIKEIIAKNLPAQVGDVLKTRLEQAERDSNTVRSQIDLIIKLKTTLSDLEKTISEYKQFDVRNSLLEKREKEATENERNLKISTLEFQLASEKEKTQFSKEVALGLVRNTEYRKTLFDSKTTPIIDQHGYTQYPNATYSSDETNNAV